MAEALLNQATIGQISVTVHDLPKAIVFYRDILGMQFLFEAPSMAFFAVGTTRLMLGVPEKPELDHPSSVIYYKVGDLRRVHKVLSTKGVTFEAEPHLVARMPDHELWMAFFRDVDNNLLALMSEIKPS